MGRSVVRILNELKIADPLAGMNIGTSVSSVSELHGYLKQQF